MKIYIRVDASLKIGTGHVMRCLTLAQALNESGVNIEFLCRELEGNLISFIRGAGFKVVTLSKDGSESVGNVTKHSEWLETSWQHDVAQCKAAVSEADCIIIDHYALDHNWQHEMKPMAKKIVVLDDLADRNHECDLLVDQNYYTDLHTRYDGLTPKNCEKLLGPKYAMLRNEFVQVREACVIRSKIKNILIFFGGVDADDHTGVVAKLFSEEENYNVDIIVGKSYAHLDKLNKTIALNPKIKLHRQVQNMADMMSKADLSIGSGGSTSWERCTLGLPTIGWPIADNQIQVIESLVSLGVFKIAAAKNLMEKIEQTNPNELSSMSKRGFAVCDGRGARLVACHVVMDIRLAGMSDAEPMLVIRNDKQVRKFAFEGSKIKLAEHEAWLENVIADENRVLLVAEIDNKIAGVVRYDIDKHEAEISIYLNPEFFGKGISKALLEKGEAYFRNYAEQKEQDIKFLVAQIKGKNKISKKLFESNGYLDKENRYIKRY